MIEKRRSAVQESRTAEHALPGLVVKQGRQGRVNGTSDCGPKLDRSKGEATLNSRSGRLAKTWM
ncbi:hypothetical protein [Marinococcus luteus]|uniref:hypothetical protein n=1 Tax=Marinococcus luteus TaxID=1122204 RepID=UPI002ACCF9BB|nr:hypothetical protein [Marinococcus luteus]MDZ5784092.1 hypothetical protein [Marinococcus luteus]